MMLYSVVNVMVAEAPKQAQALSPNVELVMGIVVGLGVLSILFLLGALHVYYEPMFNRKEFKTQKYLLKVLRAGEVTKKDDYGYWYLPDGNTLWVCVNKDPGAFGNYNEFEYSVWDKDGSLLTTDWAQAFCGKHLRKKIWAAIIEQGMQP